MLIYPKTPPEVAAEYEMLYNSGIIIWHEKARHGTIINIKEEHVQKLYNMLLFYMGPKCAWLHKNDDGTRSLEFVHTASGEKNNRPWHWCGETILFKDWQIREENNYKLMDQFHKLDHVEFEYKGITYRGQVTNKGKRLSIAVKGRPETFYMSASQVRKVE